jgi:hypothetical protein
MLPWLITGLFVLMAVIVVMAYVWMSRPRCPSSIERRPDGTLVLHPSGQTFVDMNAFQQWWHASEQSGACPIPVLVGARAGRTDEIGNEQLYATTPINKVDDYEFSRIFGYERGGRMEIPRQNFNKIIEDRTFDWADRPMTSDERRGKYAGLLEGFTASGDLKSETVVREARSRYGEKIGDEDIDCKVSREAREVAKLVARAYENEPNYEPVVQKVGPNHWEVAELKPRRRVEDEGQVEERVVDTSNDTVDVQFRYREKEVVDAAIDPYFTSLPFDSDRYQKDPYAGPVPGMERMFGPTFDHKKWY